jgi:uncharacterized protein YbbK (DUF523 family)
MDGARKPRVGISACLLGEEVRWDGRHKHDPLLVGVLGPAVEWVPVCPEVELGLGVPREPIRLVGAPGALRLVGERSGDDHTAAMQAFAERRLAELAALDLCGWVTKKDSPSCGLEGVRVFSGPGGLPRPEGTGAFVRLLRERFPLLPVEEAERLHDPALRARFLERVLSFERDRAGLAAASR